MTVATSFWARRRAAVKAEEEVELRSLREAARAQELEGKTDAEVLADMGLPNPDTMTQGDDFAAFMSRDVPEHLRKQALRTLWRSNPVLACVDGLNDYDDDYRAAISLREPIRTSYEVGLGMKAHLDEMQRKLETVQTGECEEPVPGTAAERPERHVVAVEPESAGGEASTPSDMLPVERDAAQDVQTTRRMRFRFEGDIA